MTTQITTDNIASTTLDVISGVKVSAIVYSDNDTAADPAGGQTITLNGVGFKATPTVIVNGVSAGVVTFVSGTEITFTAPANNAGTYVIYVVNPDGATAIVIPGISYSGTPTWSTAAGTLGNITETQAISNTVTATGDVPISYSLQSGTLPPGSSLNSANGLISGTTAATGSPTTYTFTIRASDAQNQDTDRQFSLTINPDVVTWSSPANNATVSANTNTALSNVTLSATSSAGYGITYTADTLPTGLSISGANITGTPTVIANTTTTLTATAATTNRTATRTINWVISVANDSYFNYTTLLLNAETVTANVWNDDASTNKFVVTVNGDTRPMAFSPYEIVWSGQFDGTNDYISTPANSAFSFGTGDFTIECFMRTTDNSLAPGGYSRSIMYIGDFDFYLRITAYHGGTDGALRVAGLSDGSTVSLKDGVWHHVALVRESNTIRLWIDGIYQTSGSGTTYSTNHTNVDTNVVGGRSNPIGGYFNGNISNVRVVKGTAVYTGTSNFTVPTSPLTAVTGTSLLTCARNRFIDASTNALAITVNDAPIISNFAPLIETDVVTGSGYFDGTGDFLTLPSNAAFSFGTGSFTVEAWVYLTATQNFGIIFLSSTTGTGDSLHVQINSTNRVRITNASTEFLLATNAIPLNAWTHIAVVRNGTTLSIYQNGVLNGSTTSTFTPPTSPLTAIANTSLLTLQSRIGENNNRFVDTSGLNNIITRNGNTTQGTFSPYSLTGWSNFFDGTGDYLTVANNAALDLPVDFTIEFWLNLANVTSTWQTIISRAYGYAGGWRLYKDQTDPELRWYHGSTSTILTTNSGIINNVWSHVAVVRQGTTLTIYVNGIAKGSATNSTNYTPGNYSLEIGSGVVTSGYPMTGYISNLRIVKGTAVYTASFTPPTSPLTAIANTSLLTCQSNRLVDNSANNFAITRNGDVSVQSFSPFSPSVITPTSYSGYFDGTGDYLNSSTSSLVAPTGDFTIEAWIYANTLTSTNSLGVGISFIGNSTLNDGRLQFWVGTDGTISLYLRNNSAVDVTTTSSSSGTITTNTWYHIAAIRNVNTYTIYVNGTSVGTTTSATAMTYAANTLNIGFMRQSNLLNYWNGYISNFRLVNGTAAYTSNFTPPTSPLTAISNTSLLTCQSSTFIDNSTNRFTITINGDAAPRSFNPFGNTVTSDVEYSVTTVGGSVLFDGSGDYLSMPHSTALVYGTNNFTIEFWIYVNAYGNPSRIFEKGVGETGYSMDMSNTGTLSYNNNTFIGGSSTTIPVPLRAWTHVALVRSGTSTNQTRWYINGQSAGTWTYSVNVSEAQSLFIGGSGASYSVNGYISNFRLVNGSAIYSAPFVPPVAPLTQIANTTLLLSNINGGIIDYTGKNNLETVGNAVTSTAVTKYGSRSLYFDGTGDYLQLAPNPQYLIGTLSFTMEAWIYSTSIGAARTIFSIGTSSTTGVRFYINSSNQVALFDANASRATAGTISANVWHHVAVVRNGSTLTCYLDGVAGTPATYSGSIGFSNQAAYVGRNPDVTAQDWIGHIDDLRITRGVARYTANFTAPTSAFTTK